MSRSYSFNSVLVYFFEKYKKPQKVHLKRTSLNEQKLKRSFNNIGGIKLNKTQNFNSFIC